MRSASAEQLSLFDEPPLPEPNGCAFALLTIVNGKLPKTKCTFRGSVIWTNCRECGHCVWDGWHQQGTSDGLEIGGDEDYVEGG